MKSFLLPLGLILCLTSGQVSFAKGNGGSNGGNVFVDNSSVSFLDLYKIPTKAILPLGIQPGYQVLRNKLQTIEGFSKSTLIPSSKDELAARTDTADKKVLQALESMAFYAVPGPIPQLNDQGTIVLSQSINGRIERLAVQDIKSKKVLVDRDLFEGLSRDPSHVAAFLLHEALIRVHYDMNSKELESTEEIGNFVNLIFSQNAENLSTRDFVNALSETSIMAGSGVFVGYKLKPDLAYVKAKFNNFISYSPQDKVINSYSGEGSGYSSFRYDNMHVLTNREIKKILPDGNYEKITLRVYSNWGHIPLIDIGDESYKWSENSYVYILEK